MKHALVATPRYLLSVDLRTKNVRVLDDDRPEYYGISWFPGQSELVLSHSGIDNGTLIDIAAYAQSEAGWISHGHWKSSRFLSQPHQILCAPDGRIICTNTGRNAVSVIDPERPGFFQEAMVNETRWDRLALGECIGDHVNSVYLTGDRLWVVAHRYNKGSQLLTFRYPELELIHTESLGKRTGLHNIWITMEGQRISCDSEHGTIIDLDAGRPLWHSGAPIYTRGLAASADYVLVGESQKIKRSERGSSLSAIWLIDRKTWKAVDYFCLGPYGAVHEVRLIDTPDEAHHGHVFAGRDALLPRDALKAKAAERLSSSVAAAENFSRWQNYAPVFGWPDLLTNGYKRADEDTLCLVAAQDGTVPDVLAFEYELSGALKQSHASAVLGYNGAGHDARMTLVMLEASGEDAVLSLWRHDGQEWARLPEVNQPVPARGCLSVRIAEQRLIGSIDGTQVIDMPFDAQGLQGAAHPRGIRWVGAMVRPV